LRLAGVYADDPNFGNLAFPEAATKLTQATGRRPNPPFSPTRF
jgi:hypothetical protein